MSRKGEESSANWIALYKGDGKTATTSSSSAQVLSIPVAVLSRDEEMGLTVYGGESGVRTSGARNKEMEMMIEENETRKEVQATLQRVESGRRRKFVQSSRREQWLAPGTIHTRTSPWRDCSTVAIRSTGSQTPTCGSDGKLRKQKRRAKEGWRRWWIRTRECSDCLIHDNREAKATKEESATNRIAFNGYHNENAIDNIIMWLLRERNKSASRSRMPRFDYEYSTLH